MKRVIFFALGFLAFSLPLARAARWATVDQDNVELRKGPGKKFSLVGHVKKGVRVHASNYSTEGFYKVRTPQGEVGWIPATSLVLGPLPVKDDSRSSPPPPGKPGDTAPPPEEGAPTDVQ